MNQLFKGIRLHRRWVRSIRSPAGDGRAIARTRSEESGRTHISEYWC